MNQSRKDAIREYHEMERSMGVYRVHSERGHRRVLGSSVDLRSALNRQRAQLELGDHPDKLLQREWDDLGPDAFTFEVIDTLDPGDDSGYDPRDDLTALEALWRDRFSE